MWLCRCVYVSMSLRVFLLQSLHPKIQETKPTRAREHFKEFWKAKLLFIFLFVAFVSLTSEVWDVEIKKPRFETVCNYAWCEWIFWTG